MNKIFLLLCLVLISCGKEKTFAEDIVLDFTKGEKMTFQEFNEGIGESGTGIIYIGKDTSKIDVKYFQSMISAPPPPPGYKIDSSNINKQKIMSTYFQNEFTKMKYSEKPVIFDSLSENNVKIVTKILDTIPKFAYNYDTQTIKKYKAFPVFIKNISGRKLKLRDFKNFPLAFLTNNQKWQMIWNENSMGECVVGGWENHYYFELNPDEIMILSVNFLNGKEKGKFKVWTGNTSSEEFEMNYDKQTIKNQKNIYFVK